MFDTLREQMLASATDAVNGLCTWAHDQPMADFDAREERVLKVGRELLATWLGQLASAAGPRSPACPKCGVHSLHAVRRRRTPRTVNSRCGRSTFHACGSPTVDVGTAGCRSNQCWVWLPNSAAVAGCSTGKHCWGA